MGIGRGYHTFSQHEIVFIKIVYKVLITWESFFSVTVDKSIQSNLPRLNNISMLEASNVIVNIYSRLQGEIIVY